MFCFITLCFFYFSHLEPWSCQFLFQSRIEVPHQLADWPFPLCSPPQCSRQTGGLRVLRAAAERQGLLLRPRRQGVGRVRAAAERRGGTGQLRLLVSAGPGHPHGRHRPHRHAHPLAALQRRRGQGVCAAEVGDAFSRGGQMRREEEHWVRLTSFGCLPCESSAASYIFFCTKIFGCNGPFHLHGPEDGGLTQTYTHTHTHTHTSHPCVVQ